MGTHVANDSTPRNHVYDALKFCALVVLPGAATLYITLGSIWGFPNVEAVVGTITAIDVFLGGMLGISSKQYNNSDARFDGDLNVDMNDPNKDVFSLEMGAPLDEVATKDEIRLKVNKA